MPEETLSAIRESRVALKGPITTPVGTGFRSVNVELRQSLDLFAAVRPARALPGVPIRHPNVDLVVIRENTEDLYQGIEYEKGTPEAAALREELRALAGFVLREDSGITVKPISVSGTRRIVRFAFEYARANGRKKVTVGHKANVMRYSDGLFLKTAEEEALQRGDVEWEEIQIDHLTSRLARTPSVRRPAAAQPLRRHPLGPVRRAGGGPRPDPRREHRLGVRRVRGRARQRSRHRRARDWRTPSP